MIEKKDIPLSVVTKTHDKYLRSQISLKHLAKELGVSRSLLARRFAELGLRKKTKSETHPSGKTTLTSNEIITIKKQLKAKRSVAEISKQMKIKKGQIYHLIRIEKLKVHDRFKEFDKQLAIDAYKVGKTVNEIAEEFNFNSKTIGKILKDFDVPLISARERWSKYGIPLKGNRKGIGIIKVEDLDGIYKDLIETPKSLDEKSQEIDVSKYVLKTRLKEAGYKLRSQSEEQIVVNQRKNPNIKHDFFKSLNPINEYWIGFIAADGAVVGDPDKKMKLSINLSNKDHQHLKNFQEVIGGGNLGITKKKYHSQIGGQRFSSNAMSNYQLSHTAICRDLHKYGITPKKTYTLDIVTELKNSPNFWRGVIDGDGSLTPLVNQKKKRISTSLSLGSGSKTLAKNFIQFLQKSGIEGAKIHKRAKTNYSANFFVIAISGIRARKLASILYEDAPYQARLERKYRTAEQWLKWSKANVEDLDASASTKIPNTMRSYEEAKVFVRSLGLTSSGKWTKFASSKDRPKDIPFSPRTYYLKKNRGWVSWLDFLGPSADRTPDYRKFTEAREYIMERGVESSRAYKKLYDDKKLPPDFPRSPESSYKKEGWKGWIDFLGSTRKSAKPKEFLDFFSAKKIIQPLALKNYTEWLKFTKTDDFPANIPVGASRFYKKQGTWTNWGDFLGNGNVSVKEKNFASFTEILSYVQKNNIRSMAHWRELWRSDVLPEGFPCYPEKVFKDKGWISTEHFLSNKREYKSLIEFKAFVKENKIGSYYEWGRLYKEGKIPKHFPSHPDRQYPNLSKIKGSTVWSYWFPK